LVTWLAPFVVVVVASSVAARGEHVACLANALTAAPAFVLRFDRLAETGSPGAVAINYGSA
jgi:hypothetical protein